MLLFAVVGCHKPETSAPQASAVPIHPTVLVISPAEDPKEAPWTPIPFEAAPTPAVQTSEQVFQVAPVPPIDVATIPNMDREPTPHPRSLTEQMRQCFTFTVTQTHATVITYGSSGEQVNVHVANGCDDTFLASDSWFEARALDVHGAVLGKEVGRFQQPIRGRSGADTVVQLNGCCDFRQHATYEASVWWAAGGGKQPGR